MNVLKFYCYKLRPSNDDRFLTVDEEEPICDTRIIIKPVMLVYL